MNIIRIVASIVLLAAAQQCLADVALVKSGKPAATIVLPAKPSAEESLSAERLQYYVKKISGATLPISSKQPAKGNSVIIGKRDPNMTLIKSMQDLAVPEESGYVATAGNTVRVTGIDERGTLNATYFLLEQLGCRWYLPGEWGTVIPKSSNVSVKIAKKIYKPSFRIRAGLPGVGTAVDADSTWALNEWGRGNHLGGYAWWGGGHSYDYMVSASSYFGPHPEWFALIDGRRYPDQLCTTDPDMRKEAVKNLLAQLAALGDNVPRLICISPNDNNSFCQCENCQKLIPTLPNGKKDWQNSIDRIADFANYMCGEIQKVYPEHYVTYYCNYHSVGTPKMVTPDKDTVFWLTHWADDQFHGVNDNSKLGSAINEWSKLGNPIFLYTYWGAYGSYSFWPAVHAISNDAVYFHNKNAIGVYSETHQNWGGQHLNFIVFPRLLWDVNTDVDAYVDEFCNKFYGPAAKPMREYYRKLETAAKNGPPQYQVMEQLVPVFNADLLKELRALIDDANAKVASADPVYATRMDFITKGFRLGEAYFQTQSMIREYSRSKDESLKTKSIALMQDSLKILADPKYHFKLTNPEFPAEPIIENMLGKLTNGTTFAAGDFSYKDTLAMGGLTFVNAVRKVGFIDGWWGLNINSNADAEIVYEMKAKEGSFSKFLVDKIESCDNISTQVLVADSIDGPWIEVANNDTEQAAVVHPFPWPFEISKAVSGKNNFFLKIHMKNKMASDICAFTRVGFSGNVAK